MWQVCTLLLVLFPVAVFSLFEDQVGSYDWHQEYVGQVSYLSVDPAAKSNRGIVVASETGVLAVLDPLDGTLLWRQVFEQDSLDAVLRNKYGSLLTVSRSGQLLRSWDLSSGQLKYEVATSLPPSHHTYTTPIPLHQSWRPAMVQAALAGKKGGIVVIASGSKVMGLVSRSGEQKWIVPVKTESVVCAVYGQTDGVFVVTAVQSKEMEVTRLNVSNGDVIASYLLPAPWIASGNVSCSVNGTHVWCVDWPSNQLHFAQLGTTSSFQSFSLLSFIPANTPTPISLTPTSNPEEVWLSSGHTHWLLAVQDSAVRVVSSVEAGLVVMCVCEVSGSADGEVWDVRLEKAEDSLTLTYYKEGVGNVGGVYDMTEDRGRPVQASVQLYTRSDQSVVFRVAMVMEDDSILMFGLDVESWVREEGLGRIDSLQFLDLPADQSAMVEDFLEKTKSEVNPIKLALLRWQLQAQLFKDFLGNLQRGDISGITSLLRSDDAQLVRDQFNTRKLIVGVTPKGKVYGLDSNDGSVVWQQFFPWLLPFKESGVLLYILRSTSHLHPPLAVLIGRSKYAACPFLALVAFDPLTGSIAAAEPTLCLPELVQTFLLSKEDRNHTKILLFLTKDMEVTSYPASPEVTAHIAELEEQLFFFVVNKEAGHMDGYYINNERSPSSDLVTFHTSHLWHISFPMETERLISIVPKPTNEHVSAVGRSRVDRSIQYKYLNPNLVAVITESTDPLRPAISVYLVDVVTGGVVFHTSHKAAVSPVHLVHSENWIVYQFLNSKLRRHELVVVELCERDSNQTRTVWSSLTPPPPPVVLSQAYAIPTSFVTMATTQTKRGIASRSILVGLKSGHLAAIPKTILDPRREVEPSDEMREAGLAPYHPELKLNPLLYFNYNQTVDRLRNIYSIASGLESTSLVLACGLDLYFTRVLPSKQFDLLAVDFDYNLIMGVVVAMVAATIILSKMSARKSLKLLWK